MINIFGKCGVLELSIEVLQLHGYRETLVLSYIKLITALIKNNAKNKLKMSDISFFECIIDLLKLYVTTHPEIILGLLKILCSLSIDSPTNQTLICSVAIPLELMNILLKYPTNDEAFFVTVIVSNLCAVDNETNKDMFSSVDCCAVYIEVLRMCAVDGSQNGEKIFEDIYQMIFRIFSENSARKLRLTETNIVSMLHGVLSSKCDSENSSFVRISISLIWLLMEVNAFANKILNLDTNIFRKIKELSTDTNIIHYTQGILEITNRIRNAKIK